MRGHHPGAVCAYMLCVLLPVVFGINPVTAGTGLFSGLLLLALLQRRLTLREALLYPGLVLLSGILNPLFNHNGRTVLFFLNRNPVTGEAALYGLVMGMMIAAALVWGRCFTLVMDTDRLLTVTGGLSPKVALLLSMALRYIPLLRTQGRTIREAQRGLGLIRESNGIDRIHGALRVFDGMVTWGLENGIVMADSMAARGYGSGRRSRYRLYPWKRSDTLRTAGSLALLGIVLWARLSGRIGYTWYPELTVPPPSAEGTAGYLAFGALCAGGAVTEIKDRIKWKYLRSKI